MLGLSGFKLYSRWVPLIYQQVFPMDPESVHFVGRGVAQVCFSSRVIIALTTAQNWRFCKMRHFLF